MADSSDREVSNNEGWYWGFSLLLGYGGTPPWLGVPAWVAGTTYGPGVACLSPTGGLYVTNPNAATTTWVSAATFLQDVDTNGVSHWLCVDTAAAWAGIPRDLTGVSLKFAIVSTDTTGNALSDFPTLIATADNGELVVSNATGGGIALDLAPERTRRVPAGSYRYDIVGTFPSGRKERLRAGKWVVDAGIA